MYVYNFEFLKQNIITWYLEINNNFPYFKSKTTKIELLFQKMKLKLPFLLKSTCKLRFIFWDYRIYTQNVLALSKNDVSHIDIFPLYAMRWNFKIINLV